MQSYLLVMLGGALGSGARFAVGNLAARWGHGFPWGTLTVNVLGCLAMGVLAGWLARGEAQESARLFLGVGLLGGFTTFSAFSLDAWQLTARGAYGAAFAYVAVSLIAAFAAFGLGLGAARAI